MAENNTWNNDPIIKGVTEKIELKARSIYRLVQSGDFGEEEKEECAKNPSNYFNKIYLTTSDFEWQEWVKSHPGLANEYRKHVPQIDRAINDLDLKLAESEDAHPQTDNQTQENTPEEKRPNVLTYKNAGKDRTFKLEQEIRDVQRGKKGKRELRVYERNPSDYVYQKVKEHDEEAWEAWEKMSEEEKLVNKMSFNYEIEHYAIKEVDRRTQGKFLGIKYHKSIPAEDLLKINNEQEAKFWEKWKNLSEAEKKHYIINPDFIIAHETEDEIKSLKAWNKFRYNRNPSIYFSEIYNEKETKFWEEWSKGEKDINIYQNANDDLEVKYIQYQVRKLNEEEYLQYSENKSRLPWKKARQEEQHLKEVASIKERENSLWNNFIQNNPEKADEYRDQLPAVNKILNENPAEKERFVIRIMDIKPPPITDRKVQREASAIEMSTSKTDKKLSRKQSVEEAARLLWVRGTNPEKLRMDILSSSSTLTRKDRENLLQINDELEKLARAFPKKTKEFQSRIDPRYQQELQKLSPGESAHAGHRVILQETKGGLVIANEERKSPDLYSQKDLENARKYSQSITDEAHDYFNKHRYLVRPEDEEPDINLPRSFKSTPSVVQTASYPQTYPRGRVFQGIRSGFQNVGKSIGRVGSQVASKTSNAVKSQAQKSARNLLSKGIRPFLAKAKMYAALAAALLLAFFAWVTTVIITVILWIFGFIVLTFIVLLIINSGAYIVPPSGTSLEASPFAGTLPVDCPSIWPVQGAGISINQGPNYCGTGASHCGHQAIDINVANVTVYATHTGVLNLINDYCGGTMATITSTCNGAQVVTWYAHLGSITAPLGSVVNQGSPIGISDNTGNCTTGPHLHYEFANNALPMAQPYIPKDVTPINCCGVCCAGCTACQTTIP